MNNYRQAEEEILINMNSGSIGLKICGLMNERDVKLCVDLGIKRLGLVTEFPSPVPWNISVEEAKRLRQLIPETCQAVMVTGGNVDTILERVNVVRPDMVQIHFKGSLGEMKELIDKLHQQKVSVIGKYPSKSADQRKIFGSTDIEDIVRQMCQANVDEILVDPRNPENADQKSLLADTMLVKEVKKYSDVPVILAGGITPENILEKWKECQADSIDIMNGSEDEPGKKSYDKIKQLTLKINNSILNEN